MLLDGSNGFSTGVISATRPDAIPATSVEWAMNMDYDDFGNLVSRFGTTSIVGNSSSLNWESTTTNWESTTSYYLSNLPNNCTVYSGFYFDTAASERLIVALLNPTGSVKQLWSTDLASSYTAITGATLNAAAKFVYFAQLNDKLFYSDGYGSLKYITSSATDSSVTAGKISRIDVIRQGSGHSSIPTITVSAPPSGVTATATAIVANDGNLVAITITNPGSGYITAPTVTISPTNQSHAVAFVSLAAPAKPLYLTTHTNRLWCVSADTTVPPDTLYFSDLLDGETWDPLGSIRVGGDGDPITGIYSWFGYRLLVFKERSIWSVDADPTQDPADWVISIISGNVGCASHRSIAAVGPDVFFLTRDGIRSLSQIQAGTQTSTGLALSSPIGDIISRIDKAQYALCDGVYWNNRYMLSVPLIPDGGTSQTTNNAVIVYHALARSWLGYWDNWQANDFVTTNFSARGPILMFAGQVLSLSTSAGQVWAFNDYLPASRFDPPTQMAYYDGGSVYISSITTKAYNLGEPIPDKIGYSIQFAFDNPYNIPIGIEAAYCKNMSSSFTDLATGVTIPTGTFKDLKAYNLISAGRWNTMQFRVRTTAESGGRLSFQSAILSGFVDSVRPQQ
jgi:hypothetical protein